MVGTSCLATNGVGLNLGSFLIVQGQSHHGLQDRQQGRQNAEHRLRRQEMLMPLLKEYSIEST
jgi:hypothetical protein